MWSRANTTDIDTLGHVVAKVRKFFTHVPNVPLLDGFEFIRDYPPELRRIARYRRRCTLNGHIFSLVAIIDGDNYTVECQRCFPHKDSRHIISSYNPFPMNESKAAD